MMTRKLYYEDPHIAEFDGVVVSCVEQDGAFEIVLDKTVFFPEGGGNPADVGTLGPVDVLYTFERGDEVVHRCGGPLPTGSAVHGKIDWEKRFRNMQNHTAEHIVSGIVHRRHGFANVGFHMGEDGVIVDFDGFVSPEELADIEREANGIVTRNAHVTARIPPEEELPNLTYRSKLELKENVRLVTIEGVDVCACCAPHVKRTGEIGVIKIFESIRRKNGVRIRMLAGLDAYEDYIKRARSAAEISALLSAKQNDISAAVERLLTEREALRYELGGLKRELVRFKTQSLEPTEGNRVFFEPSFGMEELRLLVNTALPGCAGICAAFSGSDEAGYQYVMASLSVDLRARAKEINAALAGRGGGKPEMIQGSLRARRASIEEFFKEVTV